MATSGGPKASEEKKEKPKAQNQVSNEPAVLNFLFLTLVSIRILNALTIRTFFQPDEYFQSLEPAWDLVFGNGWITWVCWNEWFSNKSLTVCQEWRERLRSAAHPLLFAGVYKVASYISTSLSLSEYNQRELLAVAPKIFQAIVGALADYWTFLLGKKLLKTNEGAWLSVCIRRIDSS